MHLVWGGYPDTVLQFPGAGLNIDLRQSVAPKSLQALATAGLTGSFAVVTACDPLGGPLDPSANLQHSIFWFDGSRFSIVPVTVPARTSHGPWNRRLA